MPVPWVLIPVALPGACSQTPTQLGGQESFGEVKISQKSADWDKETNSYTFRDGVTIEYVGSTIHADKVVVNKNSEHAVATGHVQVIDPTGTIDGESIEFWWTKGKERAVIENGNLRVGTARLFAKEVELRPGIWSMKEVRGTTSRAMPPWYEVRSHLAVIYPGKYGKIQRPTLYLAGHRILTFPDRRFNLDPKSEGLAIPSIGYLPGQGFSVNWGGGVLIDQKTNFSFGAGISSQRLPSYGGSISRTLLSDDKINSVITPSSEFGERFTGGFLENIHVETPGQEDENMRYRRKSIAFDTQWNIGAYARGDGSQYVKAGEFVYDDSGAVGHLGVSSQFRLQSIRKAGQGTEARLIYLGGMALPGISLSRDIRTLIRIDTNLFAGPNQYGWVRGIAGLSYSPVKQLRLTAGVFNSINAGTPDYDIDRLYSERGYAIRGDVNLGPTKFIYLAKFDAQRKWFDHEYMASQVIGCFEAFVVYRQYPGEYAYGLKLNLNDLTDLISRRNFERPPVSKKVISPGPDGKP